MELSWLCWLVFRALPRCVHNSVPRCGPCAVPRWCPLLRQTPYGRVSSHAWYTTGHALLAATDYWVHARRSAQRPSMLDKCRVSYSVVSCTTVKRSVHKPPSASRRTWHGTARVRSVHSAAAGTKTRLQNIVSEFSRTLQLVVCPLEAGPGAGVRMCHHSLPRALLYARLRDLHE